MAISSARQVAYDCLACGHSWEEVVWLAVDVEERPDLRAVVADRDTYVIDCPECPARNERPEPLLVLRLSASAPLVLACSSKLLEAEDPVGLWPELMQRTQEEVNRRGVPILDPVVVAPFALAAIAAERDIEQDLADPVSAAIKLRDKDRNLGEMWMIFLEELAGSGRERRRDEIRGSLLGLHSSTQLQQAFESYPELATPEAVEIMEEWRDNAQTDEERLVADLHLELLLDAQTGDLEGAWDRHWRRIGEADFVGPQVEPLLERSDPASGNWGDIQTAALELRDLARAIEDDELQAEACSRAATALMEQPGIGRPERVHQAADLFEEALALTDETEADPDDLGRLLTNLGVAVASRFEGDPLVNQERGVACLRRALELLSIEGDGRAWAMAQTNLGLGLLEVAKYQPAAPDQQARGVLEAIVHFEQALRWRSFERDPLDWAYTQINLGLALRRRPGSERTLYLNEAIHHYDEGIRGFTAAGRQDLASHAAVNRGSAAHELGVLSDDPLERQRLVEAGIADTRLAIDRAQAEGVEAGRAWMQLGDFLAAHGYSHELVEAYAHALETFTPATSPRECRDAAGRLADLASEAGDWNVAAWAGEITSEAAATAVAARATGAARFEETATNLNVFRSAAYALARVGRAERAVEILELGRARELARWLQRDAADLERVRILDPELAEQFVASRETRDELERRARAGQPIAMAQFAATADELARAIAAIRALPALDRFLEERNFSEIASAASDTALLAYPVTTPSGSLWLIVKGGTEPSVEVLEVPELTSSQVVVPLLRPNPDSPDGETGYLVARTPPELDAALDQLRDLIGPRLLQPFAGALRDAGASELCLISMGLLGRVPLHTLSWEEGTSARCLLDDFTVTFAPSAFSRSVCATRAKRRENVSSLLVVGNPLPHPVPLPGAGFEAGLIASTFPAPDIEKLVETMATKEAVRAALPRHSHIHLACHGRGTQQEALNLDCGLSLADNEWLTGGEILALEDFAPRLVVASACDTGVIPGYEEADEALALSTVLIGAGAAGVIASLWPVSDRATALMMSRFYELLKRDPASPAVALREAQLWLRDLTRDEEGLYLATRDALRSQLSDGGNRGPGRGDEKRFATTRLWGGFSFNGA